MVTNSPDHRFASIAADAAEIISVALSGDRRVLLFGAPGTGKSTLSLALAQQLALQHRHCWCLSADPGSPLFGSPGALTLGRWQQGAWQHLEVAALCSLDAGRFRLPLVSAARRLVSRTFDGVLLVDSPGVVRGVAGRELLEGLLEATGAELILALTRDGENPPLLAELQALTAEVLVVNAPAAAVRPGKPQRAKSRTALWEKTLDSGRIQEFALDRINLRGMPPPVAQAQAWTGRQVALLQGQRTLAMGEVLGLAGNQLRVLVAPHAGGADSLLLRDAGRSADGLLESTVPWASEPLASLPLSAVGEGAVLTGRAGGVDFALLNGVFGDPLLHVRLRHQRRSLLFDLGSSENLPTRVAHQVTDVFISHAHLDHVGGFIGFLRSRIGEFPPCRLYGPPGLSRHVSGLLQGALWDRVEISGPRFEVMEFDGAALRSFSLQATRPEPVLQRELPVEHGLLCKEPGFQVRAVLLDHQGADVVAYALEQDRQINVRKDRLRQRGLEPGHWLKELKQQVLDGNESASTLLPDGSRASAAALAEDLLLISPGKKLVYATDLADSQSNRQRLVDLARQAHTFFCEAPFLQEKSEHAWRNGHLTARACGEIAEQAGTARLVPFHLSKRYQANPQPLYDEIAAVCSCAIIPKSPGRVA